MSEEDQKAFVLGKAPAKNMLSNIRKVRSLAKIQGGAFAGLSARARRSRPHRQRLRVPRWCVNVSDTHRRESTLTHATI
jgi:hypothetical protein